MSENEVQDFHLPGFALGYHPLTARTLI